MPMFRRRRRGGRRSFRSSSRYPGLGPRYRRPRVGPTLPYRSTGVRGWAGAPRQELKVQDVLTSAFLTTIVAGDPSTVTGAIVLLNGIAQGTDYNARIGRMGFWKTITMRLKFGPANEVNYGVPLAQFVRVLLVVDAQPNGVVMTAAQLLQTPSTQAMANLDNRNRFTILMDKLIKIDPLTSGATPTAGYRGPALVKVYKKMSLTTTYSQTTATIGSIASNALYLVLLGDNASTSTATSIACYGSIRLRFTD